MKSRQKRLSSALVALATLAPLAAHGQDEAFLSWASRTLIPISSLELDVDTDDLHAIGDLIGDARVVALAEGAHGGAEPLELRNRLFKYLVEEHGFDAIAIESGITESRAVHDYVLGGDGGLDTVVAQGFSWGFDRWPQNAELIRYLREHNRNAADADSVHFFGFDVSNLPSFVGRGGVELSLLTTLEYLDRVDPEASANTRERLASVFPGPLGETETERDVLTGAISELIAMLKRRQHEYISLSSPDDYDWALQTAIAARQTDLAMRIQYPLVPPTPDDRRRPAHEFQQQRSRFMVDNVLWIMSQLGPDAKLMVFGSNSHVAATPIARNQRGGPRISLGVYLREELGEDLVTIGNLTGEGETGCKDMEAYRIVHEQQPTVDGLLSRLDTPMFVLDLRSPPADVEDWLSQPRSIGSDLDITSLTLAGAFDALIFSGDTTPACARDPGAPFEEP